MLYDLGTKTKDENLTQTKEVYSKQKRKEVVSKFESEKGGRSDGIVSF